MKTLKKIAAVCLSAMLLASSLAIPARAEEGSLDNGLFYEINDGEVNISRYEGTDEVVTVPAEIEGYPVTSIGNNAFDADSKAKIVYLPDSITTIKSRAFTGSHIESISIPTGVTTIEVATFRYCYDLKSVYLPEGLLSVGNYAFGGCTSLESVCLPEGLSSIGNNAFGGCTSLECVYIPSSVSKANISNTAFSDCAKLTIFCASGSGAEDYAKDKKIPCKNAPDFTGRQLALGADLTMIFYAFCPFGDGDPTVTFSMCGGEKTVAGEKHGAEYAFRFEGIAPQHMGETITATLRVDGFDDAVTDTTARDYLITLAELYPYDDELKTLIADTLEYGAAAQKYVDGTLADSELVNYGTGLSPSEFGAPPSRTDPITSGTDVTGCGFVSAGVRFENVNKIFVKFKAGAGLGIFMGDTDVTSLVEEKDGVYVFYTDGIAASDFDTEYVFRLYAEDTLVETLTYSVNAMVAAKYNDPDAKTAALVRATYNYGVSAANYIN